MAVSREISCNSSSDSVLGLILALEIVTIIWFNSKVELSNFILLVVFWVF